MNLVVIKQLPHKLLHFSCAFLVYLLVCLIDLFRAPLFAAREKTLYRDDNSDRSRRHITPMDGRITCGLHHFLGMLTFTYLKQFFAPLNHSSSVFPSPYYTKCVEMPLALNSLRVKPGDTIMDVGTGTSMLPFYMAKKGLTVKATDLLPEISGLFAHELRVYGDDDCSSRLSFEVQDITATSYPDNTFDGVTAICMLEHIADDGDIAAVREIARILKPGRRTVITLEGYTGTNFRWVHSSSDKPGLYELYDTPQKDKETTFTRVYNERAVKERLVEPSGMKLISYGFLGEKLYDGRLIADRHPHRYTVFHPLLCALLMSELYDFKDLKKGVDGYNGTIAYVVLEKTA
ncbi:class I SAM-dependent methyltransferase [Candidatus Hydrogenedentota bacterium]